jgi:hypothetical protein
MFRSKRHRGDPPGFIRWETQALGPLEVALLADIIAAKHHSKYVFTYVAQRTKGGKGGTGKSGVFEAGKRYSITLEALTTRWQRDRAKAALKMPSVADIRWHDLRGTFGSRLLRKTRNLAWVQEALGHASVNTTMRHYAHVLVDDVRQAKSRGAKRRRCFAGSAKVARKVARSAKSESGELVYVIDFVWRPRLDSNQRPTA